jgi:quercetin dioxygenase-like cupin family protein
VTYTIPPPLTDRVIFTRIDFNDIPDVVVSEMYGGTGTVATRSFMNGRGKAILCTIHPGGSVGMHKHDVNKHISYVIAGKGVAICDDIIEPLTPGVCHICQPGSQHSIQNAGTQDLVLVMTII